MSPPQGQRVVAATREATNGFTLSVRHRLFANSRASLFLSYAIFFLSGAAALIYQISWSRQVGLLFGNTVDAAAVVLASYFSGMALGYFIGAKWSSRANPLLSYGVAELTVAAWACLFPALLHAISSPLVAPWLSSPSHGLQTAARVVFTIAVLLPATAALGATLPLMAELFSSQEMRDMPAHKRGDRVALAYAINTFGAVAGVMSSVVLLPVVGVRMSSYVAAGASFACAMTAGVLGWGRAASASCNAEDNGVRADLSRLPSPSWVALAALSGFGTLALEVLYTRMFSLVFHNSTYTFAAVVAAFLMSLAIGAALTAWLQQRFRAEPLAAGAAIFGALATMLSVDVFVALTHLDYFTSGESFVQYLSGAFLLVAVVVGPPTVSLGMLLPLVWKAANFRKGAGEIVGRLSAINTIAAAGGALSASFLLLPTVGLWGSFVLVAALFFAAGAALIFRTTTVRSRCAGVAVFGALALLTLRSPVEAERSNMQRGEQIMRRWLSPYGWIDVVRLAESGSFKVRLNLHYRFGETGRDAGEYRQAHIPLLLHERPDDVLFLGLGMGLTASGALSHDEVKKVVAVELIPEVVEAARFLAAHNQGVVDHPKVEVQIDDARHYLMTANRQFDVIISDLFVPWESESGYLYTVDHYRRAQQRLKPGGLFCQWVPLYQVGTREFELIADSFAHVFPMTTIWWGNLQPTRPIVALIGSEIALECDSERIEKRLAELRRTTGLSDDYFASVDGFYNNYLGDWPTRTLSPLNSDEHPRLEFMTPVSVRDRKMVQRLTLQSYFDQVLSQLPSKAVKLKPAANSPSPSANERRAWQRFILFGNPSP